VSVRRILAIIWSVGAFLMMLWGWIAFAGPYRWAAEWQVENFGSYQEKITLFGPLIVLLIPAGFLGGWGPPVSAPTSPEVRTARARRTARIIALLGVVALVIGAVGGGLGYQRMQTPPSRAALVLSNGAELAPVADLVMVTGLARTDMIVGYQETIAGSTSHWRFVPLVAQGWRAGEAVRFVLRTNQTAWMPPPGMAGSPLPRMLQHDTPPFRMTTEPSVLRHHALPGIVRTEYEKAHVSLDPSLVVVEQSASEVYAPYWMTAAGGGIAGVCLLLGGLIGGINARKAARA
jgi:hypothetical protein